MWKATHKLLVLVVHLEEIDNHYRKIILSVLAQRVQRIQN